MVHTNNLHHTPLGLSLVLLHPCCCPLHAAVLPVLLSAHAAVLLAPSTSRCCAPCAAVLPTLLPAPHRPPRAAVLPVLLPSPRRRPPVLLSSVRCRPHHAVVLPALLPTRFAAHPALLCFPRCYPPCVAAVVPVLLPVSTILFIFIASFFTHRCCCGLFLNVLGGRCGLKCSESIRWNAPSSGKGTL